MGCLLDNQESDNQKITGVNSDSGVQCFPDISETPDRKPHFKEQAREAKLNPMVPFTAVITVYLMFFYVRGF